MPCTTPRPVSGQHSHMSRGVSGGLRREPFTPPLHTTESSPACDTMICCSLDTVHRFDVDVCFVNI
jgi:hypothetical protein